MLATTTLPIAKLYDFKPAAIDQKKLDALHTFYFRRARAQIQRALLTRGRAVGAGGYDHEAAVALMEDLVSSNRVAVLSLTDLAVAVTAGASDADIADLARSMFTAAVELTAEQTADALMADEPSPKRFLPSLEVAQ